MAKYKKITVALDPLIDCNQIMDQAFEVKDSDAEVHLVHVLDVVMIFPSASLAPPSPDLPGEHSKDKEEAEQAMQAIADKYGVASDHIHIIIGSPAKEIRKFADDHNSDLIVSGSHGRHGIGLLLGSTASSIIHGSPCDTLVVKLKK